MIVYDCVISWEYFQNLNNDCVIVHDCAWLCWLCLIVLIVHDCVEYTERKIYIFFSKKNNKTLFSNIFLFYFHWLTFWTLATMPFAAKLASKTSEIVPFVEISFIIHQWFTFRKKINGAFAHRIQQPIPNLQILNFLDLKK